MKPSLSHLHRSFLAGVAVLACTSGLAAQTAGAGEFYVDLAGHAAFPYDPESRTQTETAAGLRSGPGVTAAFGYAFREGFSTELEWGWQRVGVGEPGRNLLAAIDPGGTVGVSTGSDPGSAFPDFPEFGSLPFSIEVDGDITIQSLMGNLRYRHPAWRISPYAGFGAGVFFYDGAIDTTLGIDPGGFGAPVPESQNFVTSLRYEESRFAYQLMAGLSVRVRARVEVRAGYRFRSGRTGPFDADHVEGGVRFRF